LVVLRNERKGEKMNEGETGSQSEIVSELMRRGTKRSLRNRFGRSALDEAHRKGREDVMNLLSCNS